MCLICTLKFLKDQSVSIILFKNIEHTCGFDPLWTPAPLINYIFCWFFWKYLSSFSTKLKIFFSLDKHLPKIFIGFFFFKFRNQFPKIKGFTFKYNLSVPVELREKCILINITKHIGKTNIQQAKTCVPVLCMYMCVVSYLYLFIPWVPED